MAATTKKSVLRCSECHSLTDPATTGGPTLTSLRSRGLCYTCNFWRDLITIRRENRSVRVGNSHYLIGPEPDPSDRRSRPDCGFGGARFRIRFTDERARLDPEVVTHNLWSQGPIPAAFRDRLPNNAVFLERG